MPFCAALLRLPFYIIDSCYAYGMAVCDAAMEITYLLSKSIGNQFFIFVKYNTLILLGTCNIDSLTIICLIALKRFSSDAPIIVASKKSHALPIQLG